MKITVGELRRLVREMLVVRARVERAGDKGAGVFAADRVPRGALVSRWVTGVDRTFPPEYPDSLGPLERARFERLASFDGTAWFLSGDGGAYFNHSEEPNVVVVPGSGPPATRDRVAARDVEPGEELTMDYSEVGIDD